MCTVFVVTCIVTLLARTAFDIYTYTHAHTCIYKYIYMYFYVY